MNMEEKQEKVDGDSSGQAMKRKFQPKHFNVFWLYAALLLGLLGINLLYSGDNAKEIDWGYFQREVLQKGYVEKLVVVRNKGIAKVYAAR